MSEILDQDQGVAVVVVGDNVLNSSNVKHFKDELSTLMSPKKKIVLDLESVQFIDSAGCGAILHLVKALQELGGRLALCSVTRSVRALFELIRMQRVVDIFPRREVAVRSLAL